MFLETRTFFLICIALATFARANGAKNENASSSSSKENADDLVPTYRTPVEIILQGLVGAVGEVTGKASDSGGSVIGGFLDKIVPTPIQRVLKPVEKVTVKGFGELLNLFADQFHAIYPGTVWCGGGNIASGENDTGFFEQSDACCRDHDMCPENIEAGKSLGPLLNNGGFTRSACFCDREFYRCLKNVNLPVATNIGKTYFNVLRPQCFALDYPIVKCARKESGRLVEKKCDKYVLDTSKNKTYEWFDNADF